MPSYKYSDLFNLGISRPVRPIDEGFRSANFGEYLSMGAQGAKDGLDSYQASMAKRIQAEMEAERAQREKDKFTQEKLAIEGRNKFRSELINGKQTPELREPNQFDQGKAGPEQDPNAYRPMPYSDPRQTGLKKEPLNEREMVDSYLKNVPMSDDTDAKNMIGLLIDKNKPSAIKMKEMTDGYDVELKKQIEMYKATNEGKHPPKDTLEQMARDIGGTPYAKLVKQSTSNETNWQIQNNNEDQSQRETGNRLAEERLGVSKASYDLAVGKDFRSDQQEFGKKLVDLQAVETHLAPVEGKIANGKIDYLSSKVFSSNWAVLAQNLGQEDPELSAELGFLCAAYIKMISGAAVNEGEAVRLMGTLGVSPWSSPEKLKAGVRGMRNELAAKQNILNNSYIRVVKHYEQNDQDPVKPTPESKPGSVPSIPVKPVKKNADDWLKDSGL